MRESVVGGRDGARFGEGGKRIRPLPFPFPVAEEKEEEGTPLLLAAAEEGDETRKEGTGIDICSSCFASGRKNNEEADEVESGSSSSSLSDLVVPPCRGREREDGGDEVL